MKITQQYEAWICIWCWNSSRPPAHCHAAAQLWLPPGGQRPLLIAADYVPPWYRWFIFSLTIMLPAYKHPGASQRPGTKIDLSQVNAASLCLPLLFFCMKRQKIDKKTQLHLHLHRLPKSTSWGDGWWKAARSSRQVVSLNALVSQASWRWWKSGGASGGSAFPSRPNGGTYILRMDAECIQTLGTYREGLLLRAQLTAAEITLNEAITSDSEQRSSASNRWEGRRLLQHQGLCESLSIKLK